MEIVQEICDKCEIDLDNDVDFCKSIFIDVNVVGHDIRKFHFCGNCVAEDNTLKRIYDCCCDPLTETFSLKKKGVGE